MPVPVNFYDGIEINACESTSSDPDGDGWENGRSSVFVDGVNTYDPVAPQLVAAASSVACDASTAEFQSTMLAVANESRLAVQGDEREHSERWGGNCEW